MPLVLQRRSIVFLFVSITVCTTTNKEETEASICYHAATASNRAMVVLRYISGEYA